MNLFVAWVKFMPKLLEKISFFLFLPYFSFLFLRGGLMFVNLFNVFLSLLNKFNFLMT